MKIKFNNFSTKGKLVLLSGALVLMTGAGYAVGKNTSKDSNVEDSSIESSTDNIDNNIQDNTESLNFQENYDEINDLESDIVEFCETSLPNGFIEVNESNSDEMAELFTNAYIQINRKSLNPKTFAVLDQDLELIPNEISRDFMEFSTSIGRYYQIVTPETELPFDKLIKDKDDLEFITNLSNKIAQMNVCVDDKSRQEMINEIVKIKESLLSDSENVENYNSESLYLATKMIIYADAIAKSYGQEIITETESEMQLYSAFYNIACDEIEMSSGYVEGDYKIENEFSSQSAFESKYLSTSAAILNDMIEKVADYDANFDNSYSYGEVTKRISEKIVGLYIKPEQTNIERENEIRKATSDAIDAKTIGTTKTKTVTADKVPDKEKVPEKIEIKDEDNNIISEGYAEGLAAGRTAGSNAAYSKQTSTGMIPNNISSSQAPAPSGKSSEYVKGYKEGYAEGWNVYVSSAKAAQSTPKTEYQSVEDGKEETSESEVKDIPYDGDDEEFFEPVDNGEEIETEVGITISKLNSVKSYILNLYGESYDLTYKEENSKKM